MIALVARILSGSNGPLLIAAVVFVAAAGLVWAVGSLVGRGRRHTVEDALAPYSIGQVDTRSARRPAGPPQLVDSALLRRAVSAVGELAASRGLLQHLERRLARARLRVRPAEALFLYAVALVVGILLGLVGGLVWAVVALVVVAIAPWAALEALARRRVNAFVAQMPDMLQLLATTLRSGFSLLQGLDQVSQQLSDPIGEEIRPAVAEARLGRSIVDALGEVASMIGNRDFRWVVAAIGIQREVGGNLAELLDTVADTMTERQRLRREAQTLSAEGRIGAIIISIMPAAIGLFVYAVNPGYIHPLFHSAIGEIFFYGSIALAVVGILWTRKIVQIEV